MRVLRFGMTCTAATCAAGAIITAFTDCEDSSNGGPGATFDASTMGFDVSTNPMPVPEAGAPDVVDAAMVGCAPANMAGFVPPAYIHASGQTFDCPNHEGAFLTSVCFGDASTVSACSAFPDAGVPDGSTVSDSCNACLRSDEKPDSGTYGPFVRAGGVTVANVAGCVEIADPSDAGVACAASIQAAAVCVDRACRPSCPVTDNASRAAYVACTKLAAAGTCSTFAKAAVACSNLELDAAAGGAQQFCFSSSDPFTQFEKLAAYFCTS